MLIPDPDFPPIPDPDPEVKKAPDPGSAALLTTVLMQAPANHPAEQN
jgi:hypothetical protein